jgi:hypothetical protein
MAQDNVFGDLITGAGQAPAPRAPAPPPFIHGATTPTKQAAEARAQSAEARAQQDQALQQAAAARDAERLRLAQEKQAQDDALRVAGADAAEGERNNKAYYEKAIRALQAYDKTGVGPRTYAGAAIAAAPGGQAALRMLPDAIGDSPDRLISEQAKKDFAQSVLRSDSGANAPEPEVDRMVSILFPGPGETDPAVLANYAAARQEALVAMRAKAGRLAGGLENYTPPKPPAAGGEGQTPEDAKKASIALWGGEYYDDQGNPLGPDGGPAYDKDGQSVGLMVRVSDEAPPSAPSGPPETRDPSGLSGLGALAKQGLSLGLSDEAAGVGGYLSGFLTGEDPSKAYARERDTERQFIDKARNEWGAMGIGAELLGGGGAARIASAPNSLGQFARQGAGIGAVGGYGYGEGDASVPNALLGATGGAALGYGLGRAGNALANRAARNAPDMAVVQAGERQGVPIRQPDARPELRGQYAATESTQAGGPVVRAARAADDAAIEGRISEVGGAGTASDPYALGSRVQQAGQRYIARTKQQANRLYDRARQASQGQAVEAKDALAAVDANIAELRAAGENSNRGQIAYLEGLREDLSKPLTIEAVQNLRSNMRGQLSERNLTGTDAERRVRQVIDAANADLTRELPQEASTALRAADDFYRQRQEFITGTLQQFMGSRGNPLPAETAAKRLVSMAQGKGNFERFSNMWRELEPAEQADAAATIAASLGRRQNGDFSPAILIKSLDPRNGLNPRTARLVFGDEGAQALNDLRAIAQAKNEAMNRQSPSGQAISAASGGLKTLLMGAFGFGAGGPGGAAAGAVGREFFARWGEQRAARMLLNPDFTKWLRNAPNTANPQAIDRYFSRLAGIGSIAANDNQAFTNALMSAFRKSPGAAAAGESGDSRREPPSR